MNYGFIDFTAKYQVAPPAGHRLHLGEAGRHCAVEICQKPLSRLNKDSLCFRCQDEEREERLKFATSTGPNGNGRMPAGTGRI